MPVSALWRPLRGADDYVFDLVCSYQTVGVLIGVCCRNRSGMAAYIMRMLYVGFVLVGEIELKAVAGEYFVAAGRCAVDGRSGVVVAVAYEEVFYFGGDGGYHGVVPAVADSERQEFL